MRFDVENKVREFFERRPDECLTVEDIALKFDVPEQVAALVVSVMVNDGDLRVVTEDGVELVYGPRAAEART